MIDRNNEKCKNYLEIEIPGKYLIFQKSYISANGGPFWYLYASIRK